MGELQKKSNLRQLKDIKRKKRIERELLGTQAEDLKQLIEECFGGKL